MTKPEKATASELNVQSMATELLVLRSQAKNLMNENAMLKRQLFKSNKILADTAAAPIRVQLMALGMPKEKVNRMTLEELQTVQETAIDLKGADALAKYKTIRAGGDTGKGLTTVGSLYGKSREEILAMGGDF